MNQAKSLNELEQGTGAAHGGMGAVAPMKRSAAAVEDVVCTGSARVTGGPIAATRPARPDQQPDEGAPLRYARAGRAA